jgi:hypothetical protein
LVEPSKHSNTANLEFVRNLTVVTDPRLDDDDPGAWYLCAAPAQQAGIVRAYLTVPEVKQGFTVDGMTHKVRLEFAAGVAD